ncbi:MAG: N-acetyltransferase [Actinobacteria bacterium]|nr:N-acetyltransferase [Actinomycetota bacterium]MCI0545231.1 N-acetyltransferase [Actinomycetota bacterium]MCI0677542.1 N-acetyltransferase [Actinomycetota bacterium]
MSAVEKAGAAAVVALSASVAATAALGEGCTVWDMSQIRDGARVGPHTTVGRNVFIDHDVIIGANCKIQNNALIYHPALVGDGVFVGPGAILTNDRHPRSVNPDGTPKTPDDWAIAGVVLETGCSIGAGAVLVGGVSVGPWAMVGAGAVVTRDVAPHSLVTGNPATHVAWIGRSGRRLVEDDDGYVDPVDGIRYRLVDGQLEEAH